MLSRSSRSYRLVAGVGATALAAVALAACGGDEKPAFCGDRSNFQDSVDQVASLVKSGNLSELNNQIQTVETDAETLAESARSDYPEQTEAIESSVKSLRTSIDELPANPKAAQLATVGLEAATAVSAVKNFVDATNSDCD